MSKKIFKFWQGAATYLVSADDIGKAWDIWWEVKIGEELVEPCDMLEVRVMQLPRPEWPTYLITNGYGDKVAFKDWVDRRSHPGLISCSEY